MTDLTSIADVINIVMTVATVGTLIVALAYELWWAVQRWRAGRLSG